MRRKKQLPLALGAFLPVSSQAQHHDHCLAGVVFRMVPTSSTAGLLVSVSSPQLSMHGGTDDSESHYPFKCHHPTNPALRSWLAGCPSWYVLRRLPEVNYFHDVNPWLFNVTKYNQCVTSNLILSFTWTWIQKELQVNILSKYERVGYDMHQETGDSDSLRSIRVRKSTEWKPASNCALAGDNFDRIRAVILCK